MSLPPQTGVGFKTQHFDAIRATSPDLGFFEVHAENFMGAGGAPHAMLTALRRDYALSIHGVGLSIGSASLDKDHLARVKALCDRYQPDSFSEHLAWSSHGNEYLNDLLPLPYTRETLARICNHVDQIQDVLGRRLLLENPATYVTFTDSTIPETEFLTMIARRTGCGLLLDVNNVFVSCVNHRADPLDWLDGFPLELVGEIHLGGHDEEDLPSGPLLIDAHGREVAEPVWALYGHALDRAGPLPTLVEWDNDVPEWPVLKAEADRATSMLTDRRLHAVAQ
ncbi:MNIO family bufferin maturase [Paracoccus saliphilus]|uniref:UPF0276 protein JHX88_02660 n=1 Tax=Paracoccus saliphilus TaxID=405559 RepID=A0AA46A4A8_9RHOB|nr:DUF692 domain-containing protein [Paracoccus saliphilus]WCR03692.1 DUF692 domain-containing protein [Paracoccus saliphilus]SIS58011.1 hypothetical protein SAMN05421772_101607 [Paracoccus saliphilus]